MKRYLSLLPILLVALCYLAAGTVSAQAPLPPAAQPQTPAKKKESLATDGIFKRQTIAMREPIPYPIVREADVIWSKRIWRVIDLREKINLPLYYPTTEMVGRQSLVQLLVEEIRNGRLRAFDPDEDDEFTTLLTPDDISKKFDAVDQTVRRKKLDGTGDTVIITKGIYDWDQVREVMIKEDWFFDRHYSQMMVRIVGVCPIRVYKKPMNVVGAEEEDENAEMLKKQLFWVNYDEARNAFAGTPAYMPNNDAANMSFDNIFIDRRFNSYIIKESNVHNNRAISAYTADGYQALLESERIKDAIFTWEHDLWEY